MQGYLGAMHPDIGPAEVGCIDPLPLGESAGIFGEVRQPRTLSMHASIVEDRSHAGATRPNAAPLNMIHMQDRSRPDIIRSSPTRTSIGILARWLLSLACLLAGGAPAALAQQGLAFSNYIKSANPDPHDAFGSRVVVSGDLLAIGAYGEDGGTATHLPDDDSRVDSGAVYIYRRQGYSWVFEAYIKAPNASPGDLFGWSLDLEGDTLVVGAHMEDGSTTSVLGAYNNDTTDAGAVYVYNRRIVEGLPRWDLIDYLKPANAGVEDWFSFSLDLQGDILVVAAHHEDSGIGGVDTPGAMFDNSRPSSGAVYTYARNTSGLGHAWNQIGFMKAPIPDDADFFGFDLCLSGERLVVGAPGESSLLGSGDDNSVHWSGAAFVYQRNTTGVGPDWWLEECVKASNAGVDDFFGWSVSIDGDMLAVGAINEDGGGTGLNPNQNSEAASNSGAVYVYRRELGMGGLFPYWGQIAYLKASNTDPVDIYGNQVDLSDGKLLVAAEFEDSITPNLVGTSQGNNSAPEAGAAYLYDIQAGFQQIAYIKAPNARTRATFGHQCWFRDGELLIGSRHESNIASSGVNGSMHGFSAEDVGAVYHYRLSAPDCDRDGYDDRYELEEGFAGAVDCDVDGILDACEFNAGTIDCNLNGRLDNCDVQAGALDCNLNAVPDDCDIAMGTVPDSDLNGVPDGCQFGGVAHCFGDASGWTCPCGNQGAAFRGCANSHNPAGARLEATGVPSVSADSLVLSASGMPTNSVVAIMQGGSVLAPVHFADGLNCLSGQVRTVARRTALAGAVQVGSIHSAGLIPAQGGVQRHYQAWYGDRAFGYCTGGRTNTTNAMSIMWMP